MILTLGTLPWHFHQKFIKCGVADKGQMTRHRVDVDFGTNSHTASPQGGIDLFMGLFDGLHRFGPHIGFNPYIIRNIIYKVPAFGNDWMNANGVFIAECLPEELMPIMPSMAALSALMP